MAHRVAGSIEAFELHGLTDFDDISGADAPIHVGNEFCCVDMGNDFGAGLRNHCLVAADMVAVFMRIEDLGYGPAMFFCGREALAVIQWINSQRVTSFGAGDQVIEVAIRICGPDSLNYHLSFPWESPLTIYVRCPRRYHAVRRGCIDV